MNEFGEELDPRAIRVLTAEEIDAGGRSQIIVNSERLLTPAGNTVDVEPALAEAMVEEFLADEIVDVTRPSLYTLYSTERDFIAADPSRTIDALVELLAHDYLVHPDERLGRRQVQVAAWQPQIELWQRVAGREPPYAPPDGEPDIHRHDYGDFRDYLEGFTPAQLAVAINGANLLKSVTLGMLLAERGIDEQIALEAVAVTPRFVAGDTQEELDQEEQQEAWWREAIARLLRYADLRSSQDAAGPGRASGFDL
jgi:chaperone required for assembly of F1-ATPase